MKNTRRIEKCTRKGYGTKFTELRQLEEIDADIRGAEDEFMRLLKKVTLI
ncbi:hypothetical protein [Desulfobacter postgatei]|nr:hypothetical protein [Desulfobacter postgatei]